VGHEVSPYAALAAGRSAWASAELFIAGQLLVRAPTPDDLWRLQRATLVPLELELIARARVERLTASQVLELGAEAMDSCHADR
jgi:hypothetical protein